MTEYTDPRQGPILTQAEADGIEPAIELLQKCGYAVHDQYGRPLKSEVDEKIIYPHCTHGSVYRNSQLPQTWHGPIALCRCCLSTFPFFESSTTGPDGAYTRVWEPKDRCALCGGNYKEYGPLRTDFTHDA